MLKLGCVSYMNALPLTYGLGPQEVELVHRPPAQLSKLLLEGQVEAALLPIVNYFENPNLYLVPNLAIACRGPVKSVKLYFKGKIQKVKTIYLDSESRTSHALLKILLRDKFKIDLSTLHFTSDFHHPDLDAKLLIGDKTFHEKGSGLDLGEEWCSWQKKPFVFAAWCTTQAQNTNLVTSLQNSLKEGIKNIDIIIEQLGSKGWRDWGPPKGRQQSLQRRGDADFGGEERQDPLDKSMLKDYFTKNIHYIMEETELDGIRQFYKLLKPLQGYSHELDFKFVS